MAGHRDTNGPINVVAAALSAISGLFMGVVLFSQISLLLVPFAPIGGYVGVRAARGARGVARGLAWGGILLNSAVIGPFLYVAIRYLIE